MEFKKYDDPEEFVRENEELILEKEWLNNLMAGNCIDAVKEGINENWLLARITEGGQTELILLLRKPWKMLLYSPTDNLSEELFKFAAEEVYKIEPNLDGVNTEKEMSRMFANEYCKIANRIWKVRFEMRILVLDKLLEGNLREDVIYRRAEMKDKETLIWQIRAFHKEALHEEMSYEEAEERFNKYMQKGYYLLEKDGKIVAQASTNRDLIKGKSIGSVYTLEEERGKGYAYNVVYRASKEILENGAEYCVLFTDDANPISNHVYEKIGYERKVDTTEIDFE